jgi:HK97 family phage major capsid protein
MKITHEYLRSLNDHALRSLRPAEMLEARQVLRDVRETHTGTLSRILDAVPEGRDLTKSQRADYAAAEQELDAATSIANKIDDAIAMRSLRVQAGVVDTGTSDSSEYRDGVPLTGDQSFAGFTRARNLVRQGEEELSLRKSLRGIVLGDWSGADAERRAMSESVLAGGGYLLPTVLSSSIVDLARNQTQVLRAGARIFPMANKKVDVAKWTGDPSMAWHTEAAAISPSDATIGKVTLDAKALAGLTLISRELLEDASEVDAALRAAFAATMALTVDRVAIYGTGVDPEPRGVKNTSGILTASMGANGAALTNYDPLVDAVGTLRDNNEDPTAAIYSPRTGRALAKLKDTTNQPLTVPGYLDGVPRYETNQIPNTLTQGASTLASDMVVGDFRQLYVGVRTQLQIQVLSERYADTGQVGILAWFRGDVAVARPKAFHVTSGVL